MLVSRASKRSAPDSPPAEDAPEAAGDARGGARKRRLPAWASGAAGASRRRDDDVSRGVPESIPARVQ